MKEAEDRKDKKDDNDDDGADNGLLVKKMFTEKERPRKNPA